MHALCHHFSLHLSQLNVLAFDPLADCVASAAKRKKKAVRIKPRKITVVLVDGTDRVPRFGKRKALKNEGKIRQLQFTRNMSAEQVKKNIIHGFSDKVDKDNEHFINFLQPDLRTHTLTKLEGSNFDGADVIDIAGQGSLYVHIQVGNISSYVWFLETDCLL